MRQATIFMMLIAIASNSFCQQTSTISPLTKTDYLAKSKRQKTAAWVLLGGGTAMVITGSAVWAHAVRKNEENANDPFTAAFAPYTTTSGTTLTLTGLSQLPVVFPYLLLRTTVKEEQWRHQHFLKLKQPLLFNMQTLCTERFLL
jgi:hypothetical protein